VNGGIPLALHDKNLNTLMISPFSNFLVGIQAISLALKGQFACGIQGKVLSIPRGFFHSTIITASVGINFAHNFWGS